jgi:hypothetical protein
VQSSRRDNELFPVARLGILKALLLEVGHLLQSALLLKNAHLRWNAEFPLPIAQNGRMSQRSTAALIRFPPCEATDAMGILTAKLPQD